MLSLASCVKEGEEGWGYIGLSVSADMSMSDAVRSAEALPEAEYKDYTIMLYKDGSLLWETSFAEFTSDPDNRYRRVPAGEYVVYVESCTADEAEEGFGIPRYAASRTLEVTAGRTSTTDVVCTMVNAKVTLAYAPDFDQKYHPWGLSVADSWGRKLALDLDGMSSSHEDAQVMYFNVPEGGDAALVYTLVATDVAADKVMRYDVDFSVKARMWNKVTMTSSEISGQ